MDKIKQPPSMSGHVGIVGELVDFGRVKNDLGISDTPSYFLELRNNNGGTTTIWGQELYETLVKSNKQIGEMIQLNHLGKQLIEQRIAIRNKDGKVTHYENQTNWKNVWEIVEPNNTSENHSLPVPQRDIGKKKNNTNKLEQNSLSNISEIMNYITNSELEKIGSINGQTQTVEQHKPFRHKKGLVYRTIRTSGTYGFSNHENSRSITPFEMRQIEIPTTLIDAHENKLVLRRLEFDEICHLGLGHTLCFPISGIKYRFDIAELQLYCNFDVDLQVLKAFDIQDKPVYLLKNMDLDVLRSSLNSPFRFVSSIAVRMLDVNVNTLKASLPDRIFNKDLNSSQKMDLLIGRSIEILNAELNTLSSEDLMVSAEPINRDILKLVYWRRNSPETRIDILSSDLEFLHENEQRKFLISEFQKIHFYINKISSETETQQVLSALDLLQDQEYITKETNNIVFQMPEFNTLGLEEQMELFPDFANSIALPLTKEDKSRLLSIGTLELDGRVISRSADRFMIISEDNSYEYLKQVAANYKSEKLQDLCNHNKDIHITLDNELFFLNKELLTKAKEINAEERVIMEAAGKIPSMVANLRLKSDDKIKLVQNGSIKKCKNIICLTNLNGRLIISMNDGQSSEIVLITKKK